MTDNISAVDLKIPCFAPSRQIEDSNHVTQSKQKTVLLYKFVGTFVIQPYNPVCELVPRITVFLPFRWITKTPIRRPRHQFTVIPHHPRPRPRPRPRPNHPRHAHLV